MRIAVASSGTAARCCSTSARSPTGRCRGERVPDHAPRDRADHPVHHRRRRGPPAHQQGRGAPAGSPGPAVPLRVKDGRLQLQPAQAAARVGAGVARLPAAPGSEPERSRAPRRVSPSAISQVERGERRALPRDADGPVRAAQRHPR
jgi:hypothetical protein